MFLKPWEALPESLKIEEVKVYYDMLSKKRLALAAKRLFDLVVAFIMCVVISPVLLGVGAAIKLTSKGPIFFRQTRITQFGREFRVFKFRTMTVGAEGGAAVTVKNDCRVTKIGRFLRKFRLDEFPQLFNIVVGSMSFVGVRPEVPKYVSRYEPEMLATLLLPAGVTSPASIEFRDEEKFLQDAENVDETYVLKVLPPKMKYNLEYLQGFSFFGDLKIMLQTVWAVLK